MPGLSILASTLGSLTVILGVLFAAAYLARRLRNTPWGTAASTTSPITIIATRALGAQTTLAIIEASNQRFLIGISRAGLTALGRLDGHE